MVRLLIPLGFFTFFSLLRSFITFPLLQLKVAVKVVPHVDFEDILNGKHFHFMNKTQILYYLRGMAKVAVNNLLWFSWAMLLCEMGPDIVDRSLAMDTAFRVIKPINR